MQIPFCKLLEEIFCCLILDDNQDELGPCCKNTLGHYKESSSFLSLCHHHDDSDDDDSNVYNLILDTGEVLKLSASPQYYADEIDMC
jgi:hypothetical protein